MDESVYIVFDGDAVIGFNEEGWEAKEFNFFYVKSGTDMYWKGTNIYLKREQVIDLLEYKEFLDGNNVYKLKNGFSNLFVDELKKDTKKTMRKLSSMGKHSNAELIEILKSGRGDTMETYDMVTKPPHYMLEDGTEVKYHIRSLLGDDGFKSWAIGNAIKYVSRYKDKGKPTQDLKKAQENIQMVIDVLGEQDGLD